MASNLATKEKTKNEKFNEGWLGRDGLISWTSDYRDLIVFCSYEDKSRSMILSI